MMNENIEKDQQPVDNNPGVKVDPALWKIITEKYEFAQKKIDYDKLPDMWEEYEKQYDSKFWEGSDRPAHLTRFTSNDFFEAVEVVLPLVTARPPRPDLDPEPPVEVMMQFDELIDTAQSDEEKQLAIVKKSEFLEDLDDWIKRLSKELVNIFTRSGMKKKLEEAFREYEIKGTVVIKSEFDKPDNPGEKGNVRNKVCDMYSIFPDPNKDTIEECEKSYLIEADYMDIEDIYKEYGIRVEPEGDIDESGTFRKYSLFTKFKSFFKAAEELNVKKGYALVIRYYCAADETDVEEYKVELTDDNGEWQRDEQGEILTESKTRSKYPYGKLVTIIRSLKNKIVREEARPYKRLPFFSLANYKRANKFFGTSEGKNIESYVHGKNMLISNIIDNARLTGNPQKSVGPDVQDEVDNEPGRVYKTAFPESIRNIEPASIPSYIFNILEYLDADRDKKTGIQDAFRAESQAGDSGTKTKALIAQATGRMQPKINDFVELCRRLYEHWIFIIRTYYPEVILQKEENEKGLAYSYFEPRKYNDVQITVNISALSMMPFDNYSEWEEGNVLFDKGQMSGEQLIDLAPTLRDKNRAKEWVEQKIEAETQEQAKLRAFVQFQQIAGDLSAHAEKNSGSPEEEQLFNVAAQIIQQFPEFIGTPDFQGLPPRVKTAMATVVCGVG